MSPGLLLLTLCLSVMASKSSTNLTITFSADGMDTCASRDSGSGIGFTTDSLPDTPQCFNLNETFGTNSSTGQRDSTTAGLVDSSPVTWFLTSWESYDPAANYSLVWYQQTNGTGQDEAKLAARRFNAYPVRGCSQGSDESPGQLLYGWEMTCQSSDEGECYRTNLGIQSFLVSS